MLEGFCREWYPASWDWLPILIVALVTSVAGYVLAWVQHTQLGKTWVTTTTETTTTTASSTNNFTNTEESTDPTISVRTVCTQSMCTYRRKLATPRFEYIAPQFADGAWVHNNLKE